MPRGPILDDFEYPAPKRETLWTLPNAKRRTTPMATAMNSIPRHPCRIDDIDGAQHGTTSVFTIIKKFSNKPEMKSIEGSSPKRLITVEPLKNNYIQDKSLMTSDLPHCKPEAYKFRTSRTTDPLEPIYRFATPENVPAAADVSPLRQVRDVLKISDIYGTTKAENRSNNVIRTELPPRDNINYSDVLLSTAGSKSQSMKRKSQGNSLNTKDICTNDVITFQTNRSTNPLEPIYTVYGQNGKRCTLGTIEGSKPRSPKQKNDRPSMILRCDDIVGAQPLKRF